MLTCVHVTSGQQTGRHILYLIAITIYIFIIYKFYYYYCSKLYYYYCYYWHAINRYPHQPEWGGIYIFIIVIIMNTMNTV